VIERREGFTLDTPTSVNVTKEKQALCLMSQEKTSSEYVRTTSSSSDVSPRSTCIGRAAFIPWSDVCTVRTAGQELLTSG
jgi:hypothetical protein